MQVFNSHTQKLETDGILYLKFKIVTCGQSYSFLGKPEI